MNILPYGESAVSIRFGECISDEVNAMVNAMSRRIERESIAGVKELVPSYCALLVCFDPGSVDSGELTARLQALDITEAAAHHAGRLVKIPVCYGGEYGPDLSFVAEHSGMSSEQVIRIHTAMDYPVYMLGFTPGFPYLGGMDARIETPRLQTPRKRVEAGSVGIAGAQTGVYPVASPGGWQIIGRTPVKLYDPARTVDGVAAPFLLNAGDTLRFTVISEEEYESLAKEGRQ